MTGHAGHAGGTPYDRRRDALIGASELVIEVERLSKEHHVIGTVGRLQAFPGGVNVIPGRVEFSLDLRAEFDEHRDECLRILMATANEIATRRNLKFSATEIYRADAVLCDSDLQDAIRAGISSTGDADPMAFWSRAGHDGMAVVDVTRFAMLFIRCKGGVSHHPDESVKKKDVAAALVAFEGAVLSVAATATATATAPASASQRS
jgi:allantoate deiminase